MPASSPSPVAPVVAHPEALAKDGSESLSLLVTGETPAAPPSYDDVEDSDVFLCETAKPARRSDAVIREVTLFVHGWHNVEPGLLSWTFPSLRAALDAVQRMKNAIGWCVVSGTSWRDLETARASGAVLVEQLS